MSQGQASVEYFRNILDNQTQNLSELCDRWSQVLEHSQTPSLSSSTTAATTNGSSNGLNGAGGGEEEEANDDGSGEEFLGAIRSTIGQAKLLMSQRFKQFSDLIDHCEFNTGQHPTRLNDLSGFWEMISFQVEDVVRKFKSLDEQWETTK